MDNDKAPGETVAMVQLNDQNSNDDIRTAPASPTSSQKSISIINKEKNTETISIDVSGEVPLMKKKVTHEESLSLLNPNDMFSMLPVEMRNTNDTTNGASEKDPNAKADKKSNFKDAPDGFNQYRNEKSFSQGLLDIALFTSNVNQLRAVTNNPREFSYNFYFIVFMLVLSIVFQIGVGLILLLSARYNVNKEDERKVVYKMGSYVVAGVFLITVLNLIIAVFYNYDNPSGTPPSNKSS